MEGDIMIDHAKQSEWCEQHLAMVTPGFGGGWYVAWDQKGEEDRNRRAFGDTRPAAIAAAMEAEAQAARAGGAE
jgi:hypothetical protein